MAKNQSVNKPSIRTEPICFERTTVVEDDYGQTVGPLTTYPTLAEVYPMKSSRLLEANQQTIRQGYRMIIWVPDCFEPRNDDTIRYRDETLTLTGFRYLDMSRLKYELTVLEQANGQSGTIAPGA